MPDSGKVDGRFFDRRIYPHLGAEREEVRLGPRHGVDFGVVDVGERSLVVATDPISIVPDLGFERAARFAFDVVCADVAVSGLSPAYLSMNFTLPPGMTDAEFAAVWEAIDEEARDLGASVVAGHTARYAGCSYPWVGGATVMAVGDPADLVRPDGARPGDDLLLTTGPGVEAVGLLTTLFGEKMDLPESVLDAARDRFDEARGVRD
ncbi:AIR synthase related protein, partial [Halococcus hamelinensis]